MIKNNKTISLTIIGFVLGLILAVVANSPEANMLVVGPFGGIVGFLAGWIWQSRSGEAKQ